MPDEHRALAPVLSRVRRADHWLVEPGKAPSRREAPLTDALLVGHFEGRYKIGACPMQRGSSTTRLALFDLDDHDKNLPWSEMAGHARKLISTAAEHGIRLVPFRSSGGHGIHLICIFDEEQDARSVRAVLGNILVVGDYRSGTKGVAARQIEIFVKQDSVPADGYGSMFILPLAGKSVALDPVTLEPIGVDAIQWLTSDSVPFVKLPAPVERTEYDTPELARVQSALDALDPADFGYGGESGVIGWLEILFAVHHATEGSAEGLAMVLAWSSRWPGYDAQASRAETEKQWAMAKPGKGIGAGTLFHAARAAGWVDPEHAPNADGFENLVVKDAERLLGKYICDDKTWQAAVALADDATLAELEKMSPEAATAAREVLAKANASARAEVARFKIEPALAFAQRPGVTWSIKHVLPRFGLAVIYGAPGSGKSFMALDMVAAVARGVAWRGRKVRKGRVVYVAAEGVGGFASRVRAYQLAHELKELDVGIVGDTPNFYAGDDGALIAHRVAEWGGADVVVVDTLAAASAGADENTGKDMNLIVGRMNELQAATGALVILIHHSGKDESKGARGWSGLKAAVDVEIEVSRPNEDEPGRVARVTKQKDGESGAAFPFELRSVTLGNDEDGEPVTSCVVEVIDGVPTKKGKAPAVAAERRPRGQYQQVAYDTVRAAEGSVPHDKVVAVVVETMPEPEAGKRDQRVKNARAEVEKLIRGGFLETTDGGRSLRPAGLGGSLL